MSKQYPTAEDVLNVARAWLGYSEANGKFKEILNVYNSHRPLAREYDITPDDHWCDCFVSAVAIKANAVDLIGTEVGCEEHVQIFKKKGIWIEDGTVLPKPGDIVLYNWNDNTQPNDGRSDHIGIVEQVYGNTVIVIEGNMDEKVGRRTINRGWGYIRGYARPKYAEAVPAVPIEKKTIDEICEEVIRGAWGDGEERKEALTKAGYDYYAIQERVTKMLSGNKAKKAVDKIAWEVIDGKWGNGARRKEALTKSGYNANAVQDRVNEFHVIAREVLDGKWGDGDERKCRLTQAGYDYEAIRKLVNRLWKETVQ